MQTPSKMKTNSKMKTISKMKMTSKMKATSKIKNNEDKLKKKTILLFCCIQLACSDYCRRAAIFSSRYCPYKLIYGLSEIKAYKPASRAGALLRLSIYDSSLSCM